MKKKTKANKTIIQREEKLQNNKKEQYNERKTKNNKIAKVATKHKKVMIMLFLICIILYVLYLVLNFIKNPVDTFLVEQGQIYQEESSVGYIIRDETVLKGQNYKNGMSQIKAEGERVAKGEPIFRYYSNGEEDLIKKIKELDEKIDTAMANQKDLFTSDTKVLENQISDKLDAIYQESDLTKVREFKKDINTYITKKAKITGDKSPAGSYLKKLIDQRSSYENKLNSGAEYLNAPISGVVSYRVDGYEEILKTQDFSKITKEFLESLNLKTGQIIAASNESGKIIDNYKCYIATILNSNDARQIEVGDKVKIKLPSGSEIIAEIEYINEETGQTIIIFKIERCVEELINYRKISINIIWWSDSGKKIPNTAIAHETKGDKELPYVVRVRAGYEDKILVKVLRKNDKYSIVTNYTSKELDELGYASDDDVRDRKITLYDEILMKP